MRFVREGNALFHHEDIMGRSEKRLSLFKVMKICYNLLYTTGTVDQAVTQIGMAKETVTDWYEYCRATVSKAVELEPLAYRHCKRTCANQRKLLQRKKKVMKRSSLAW